MTDPFDTLLAETLAPPERAPDHAFAARVGAAVAAAERMRAWRRRTIRAATSEALVLAALASGALALARLPGFEAAVSASPLVLPVAAGAVLLAWLALSPRKPGALAI